MNRVGPDGVYLGTAAHYAAEHAIRSDSYGQSDRYPHITTTRLRPRSDVGFARRGRYLHRTAEEGFCALWLRPARAVRFFATWQCGSHTSEASFGTSPEDLTLCPACSFKGAIDDGSHVYFAERDGLIKIGCSVTPAARSRGLGALLLATQPGGFGAEADMHERFHASRISGEWFLPEDNLLAHIASLRAQDAS